LPTVAEFIRFALGHYSRPSFGGDRMRVSSSMALTDGNTR
jgi:hypothetical protein